MSTKININYTLSDLCMKPKENIEIYCSDKNNNDIGFVKIHITDNNQIVIFTDGIYNTQSNIINEVWKGNIPFKQTIRQLEDIDDVSLTKEQIMASNERLSYDDEYRELSQETSEFIIGL